MLSELIESALRMAGCLVHETRTPKPVNWSLATFFLMLFRSQVLCKMCCRLRGYLLLRRCLWNQSKLTSMKKVRMSRFGIQLSLLITVLFPRTICFQDQQLDPRDHPDQMFDGIRQAAQLLLWDVRTAASLDEKCALFKSNFNALVEGFNLISALVRLGHFFPGSAVRHNACYGVANERGKHVAHLERNLHLPAKIKQGNRDNEGPILEVSDSQPKRFHAYINHRRKAQPGIPELIAADGKRMLSDREKAQALALKYRGV
ncbi:unnamed protein product [Dibothriocephalus latus]|uniref:Uncharacterized protein n=1 Tax=Dibothriocephalus latus TaxID=60516 RepID=A0A3P6Q866_DIBLA|nr:unnamed protein product [Dibothriocephalus latus]